MITICMLRNWLVTSRVSNNWSQSHDVSLSNRVSLNGRRRSEVVSPSWSHDLPLRDPSCQTQLLLLSKDCLYIVVCKSLGSLDHTLCTCFWIYLPLFLAELFYLYTEEMGSFGMNFKISSVWNLYENIKHTGHAKGTMSNYELDYFYRKSTKKNSKNKNRLLAGYKKYLEAVSAKGDMTIF